MSDKTTTPREITFRVRRFDPDTDTVPHWDEFRLHVHDGMTVLEALHQLKAEQTPTLAYRSSCRMGVCGSCGMFVNDLPMLACQSTGPASRHGRGYDCTAAQLSERQRSGAES